MRVDLISPRGLPLAGSSVASLAEWRVGAILQALAVRDASSQLFLDINGQRHPARLASGEQGPADGERLTLRVLRNSPVLALERVPDPPRNEVDTELITNALRKFVPRQTSPAQLFANLAWIVRGDEEAESLPQPVRQMAAKLWQALADVDALSDPMRLERALSRSGAFLESILSKDDGTPAARAAVASDLKALMLQFARTLREHGARPSTGFADTAPHAPLPTANGSLSSLPATPATLPLLDTAHEQMNELARQTEGALARVTTTQVSNSAQDGPLQSLLIELPIRLEDRASIVRLRIERDGSRHRADTPDAWTLEAALDLGTSGALHARVSLSGFRVGVQLRADSPAIVEKLNARAEELESVLRDAGLEVDRIVCRHGMPVGDTGQRLTRLLDLRA